MVNAKEKIGVSYNNEKDILIVYLNQSQSHIKDFTDINIDIIIIEILEKDRVDDNLFLEPEINKNSDLINQEIYIPQFPRRKELSYSSGNIIKISGNEITHTASTKDGSSGSHIFLENSRKVIGIHKSGDKSILQNYGDLLYPIINVLNIQRKIYLKILMILIFLMLNISINLIIIIIFLMILLINESIIKLIIIIILIFLMNILIPLIEEIIIILIFLMNILIPLIEKIIIITIALSKLSILLKEKNKH